MLQSELLHEIRIVLAQGQAELKELRVGMSLEQWFQQPEQGWSAFQTLEHINITLDLYLSRMREVKSRLKDGDSSELKYRPGWMGTMMIGLIKPKPDGGIKPTKTLKVFEGKSVAQESHLIKMFKHLESNLNHFDDLLVDLDSYDLNSRKINSGIGPIMRFRFGAALEFLSWHHLRHFRQICRISGFKLQDMNYPTLNSLASA